MNFEKFNKLKEYENPFAKTYSFSDLLQEAHNKKNYKYKRKEKAKRFAKNAAGALYNNEKSKIIIDKTQKIAQTAQKKITKTAQDKFNFSEYKNISAKSFSLKNIVFSYLMPISAIVLFFGVIGFLSSLQVGFVVKTNDTSITVVESEASFQKANEKINTAMSNSTEEINYNPPKVEIAFLNFQAEKIDNPNDAYEKMLSSETETVFGAGLYIDGVYQGAVDNKKNLEKYLSNLLQESKADYDSFATAKFNNEIKIEESLYPSSAIVSAENLIESCKGNLTVQLETTVDYYSLGNEEAKEKSNQKTADNATKNSADEDKQTYQYLLICSEEKEYVDGSTEGNDMFVWPVPYTTNITSVYGPRWGAFHYGLDIADAGVLGTDIIAASDGVVTYSGEDNSGYGKYVIIDHGNGYKTLYGHASSLNVKAGQTVKTGDVIAAVGSTGNSTGPHLHFEVIENGVKKNPLLYL